ncbi:MAG: hypothetical protein ACRDN9_09180, partial [Streptosporangiaceae bacterium]
MGREVVADGAIPTLQHATFGRVYAAYGGVFAIMSLLWGWGIDGQRPDLYEWVGAAIIATGVGVLYFAPHPDAADRAVTALVSRLSHTPGAALVLVPARAGRRWILRLEGAGVASRRRGGGWCGRGPR